jgi:hypothetical protein
MNGIYHGDDVLNIGHVQHLTSTEVDAEIHVREFSSDAPEISDGAAAAIASWWQAPKGHGYAFAQLASTGRVRLEDLADDISGVYDIARAIGDDPVSACRYMDYLSTWALNHPSRQD